MPNQQRVIKKSAGSTGRSPNASETGKRGATRRPNRVMAHGGESRLVVEGKFSDAEKKEIFALIEAAGHHATRKDPKATIDLIEEKAGMITVYVSDNHLALVLGKKLHAARKGGELTITWSHDDMPVYVHWRKK